MKAISMPINILVVLVLALVILIGLMALFFGVFTGSSAGINLEAAKNSACQRLVTLGCDDPLDTIKTNNFDANGDGFRCIKDPEDLDADDPCVGKPLDTLEDLCQVHYGIGDQQCKELCNCG